MKSGKFLDHPMKKRYDVNTHHIKMRALMINMKLSELATLLGTEKPSEDVTFTSLCKDTRSLPSGCLYIAIIGESLDGHQYVEEAYKKGAVAALVSRKVDSPIPQIVVDDTIAALGKIGEHWRDRFTLPIAGVTGSNGKTTLKNMIASIMRAACKGNAAQVLATEGNLNNAIGVPLMLSRLSSEHRYGVIEMGMNNFGEIAYLTKMVKPAVAVINNAAEAHLQGLRDVAGVAHAKGEIFSGLQENGIAILNKDDAFFNYWLGLISGRSYFTFGLRYTADVTAIISQHQTTTHQKLSVQTPKGNFEVNLPLLGRHNVMNALATTATAIALDFSLDVIQKGLETVQAAPGRLCQTILANGARIIDDTYNANPCSTAAAIHSLSIFEGEKILVLADMKELGPESIELHASTGQLAHEAGINHLFTLGELSAAATEAFGENAEHFTDRAKLVAAIKPHLQKGTTILVKGSHSMHMETVVADLMAQEKKPAHINT